MRYMGWTWDEFLATPVPVLERLIETLQREQQDEDGAALGPRDRRMR